jgi:hypothetical protein
MQGPGGTRIEFSTHGTTPGCLRGTRLCGFRATRLSSPYHRTWKRGRAHLGFVRKELEIYIFHFFTLARVSQEDPFEGQFPPLQAVQTTQRSIYSHPSHEMPPSSHSKGKKKPKVRRIFMHKEKAYMDRKVMDKGKQREKSTITKLQGGICTDLQMD